MKKFVRLQNIPVSKPYLPSRERLDAYIDGIYQRAWLTNNGELVQQLEKRLKEYLGVEYLLLVANGTLAIQVALKALGVTVRDDLRPPQIITTPFTFVATASAPYWEGADVCFADIDEHTWCLSPESLETAITERTKALLPVHVFGNACYVEAIDLVAKRHHLKVIYDASHAFGVQLGQQSLLRYGDAATLSFHATKVFHTIEGGAIVFKNAEDLERARLLINFGITGPDQIDGLGINAKMNEFQAAMGLSMLDEIKPNLHERERVYRRYHKQLDGKVTFQKKNAYSSRNYSYFPILLPSERQTLDLISELLEERVVCRRYFFPSLDTVKYLSSKDECLVSRDIASRVLCLPIYSELTNEIIDRICEVVCKVVSSNQPM